jgi:hypothetical protein
VLAEAVHIDGTLIAIFLAFVAVVVILYVVYLVGGFFWIRRGTSPAKIVLIGIVSALDLVSLAAAVPTGREERVGWGLLLGPIVHGVAWLLRVRRAPEPQP